MLVAVSAALAPAAWGAPAAQAEPEDPFNPSLSILADTYAGGAHPNLSIRLSKPSPFEPPQQQDVKRLALTLPAGLAADPNAEPRQCHPDMSEGFVWRCVPEVPPIGEVRGWAAAQFGAVPIVGDVYMGVPQPGEQAHLVILAGIKGVILNAIEAEANVSVDPAGRITAVVDNLPDTYMMAVGGEVGYIAAPPYDFTMTLWGNVGAGSDHPLLANPTSCSPKEFAGEAQGYLQNVYAAANAPGGYLPGYGEGKTVPVSAPYPVTGCNSVPYAPTFDLSLDSATPSAAPAVTTTITQGPGEATTGRVAVKFPKGFRVNFDNKNGQCKAADFEVRACPAESAIGEARADSNLLPVGVGELKGNVYLGETDFQAGNIKLLVDISNDFLPGGIRLAGETHINADGTLEAVFDSLPELPLKSFTMSLAGGKEKGLLLNPKTCGERRISTELATHQGKILKLTAPVEIACDTPTLDVGLTSRRPGSRPTISMDISGSGIGDVSFTLPSQLRVKRASRLDLGRSYGALTVVTPTGRTAAKLILLGGKAGAQGAWGRRTPGGLSFAATEGGASVFEAGLSVAGPRQLAKRRKGTGRRRAAGAKKLDFSDLPADAVSVALELEGKRGNFLRLPSSCRGSSGKPRRLNFSATVTSTEGDVFSPTVSTAMSCKGKRRSKRGR